MQRAGVLIAIAAAASEQRASSLEGIARAYAVRLRRRVRVPSGERDRFLRYAREQRLWKRYPALQTAEALPPDTTVELQDLWLADPRLPAATGAVTDEVTHEPPQLAASVRLVRDRNFTRTDRGRALLTLVSERELALLEPPASVNEVPGANLLLLSPGVRAFLTYSLLDADLDFVRAAWEVALVGSGAIPGDDSIVAPLDGNEFTRVDFSMRLNKACRLVRHRWTRRARSGADRQLLARLEEWAKEIDKGRQSGARWGGGRPPEQLATLRLEPYVDLGLVTRLSRSAYRYRLSDPQRAFFESILEPEEADAFLSRQLFARLVAVSGTHPTRVDRDEIWARMVESYGALRSPLGFAAFDEVTLLAISTLLDEQPGRYFEVGDGIDVLREQQKREPRRIRLGIRRGGGLSYMKIAGGREA
jgi:hypothetical protein